MRATPLMLAIALGLGLPASSTDAAAPSREATLRAESLQTYIVVFEELPAASFRGFSNADKHRPRLAATSPVVTGARKYNARSVEAVAYVGYLAELRRSRLNEAALMLVRPLEPNRVFSHAMNGMSIDLTPSEAAQLAKMPGVQAIEPEFKRYLQTERGPQWINADDIWSGAANGGVARRGEGVIVGVIDSGINRTHVSFSGTGISNPLGSFRGYCVSTPAACNTKLIGLWDFVGSAAGNTTDPVDSDGHGTHTASTAVGNPFLSFSGVAPRANIIAYKACPGDTCTGSALLASIDQAVADGVDVINYSIGSGPDDPWRTITSSATDDSKAFLAAREAGIVVAAAAGNDGPNPGTHNNPANAPWVMGVAAASHDRNGTSFADMLASFSGRGPVIPFSVLKPDITAPGRQIVAAGITGSTSTRQLSGTSMATPHIAGAAALLQSINPAYTADQIVSALALTARSSIRLDDLSPTTPHEQGAGMVDVALAARAGAYLEVAPNSFRNARANSFTGGAHNLNLPSLTHGSCFQACTLSRTFKLMPGASAANYSIQSSLPAGATVTPSVASFTTSAGGQTVNFTVNVDSPSLTGKWVYGSITLVNNSGDGRPNLKLPVAVYASPFATQAAADNLALVARSVIRERDFFDLDVTGVASLPSARFVATSLVTPVSTTQNITVDPTPREPYDDVTSNYTRLVVIPATPVGSNPVRYRLRATTSAAEPDIDLFVGRDSNNNGRPDESEELCRSVGPASDEICDVAVTSEGSPITLWIMVQNWGGPGTNVKVDSFLVPMQASTNNSLVATGPGTVPANSPLKLRIAYDDPSMIAGSQRLGYVMIQPAAGNTAIETPVVMTRTGTSFEPFALANGIGRPVTLPASASHTGLYFDVPPHATSVEFRTTGSTGNVDLYVARVASPTGPAIAAAPAHDGNAATRAATASGDETLTLSGGNLLPGRWYVVPTNATGAAVSATVTATVTAQGARPGFLSGQYVNSARDGHGIFVDFAGPAGNPDQWVTVWYTYLEDNTPTWYYSQGAAPTAAGIWKAELFRVVWNGSATHAVDVGDVIITETGPQSMTFNFNLDGRSGFERMLRAGGGSCPQHNGQALDASGHWFSPSLSGFGYTYLAAGGSNPQEVFIPYVYDGAGFPRWLYGQRNFSAAVNSFDLGWFSGFPPLAPAVALSRTPAGTATRTLATNNVTDMSVNSSFGGALTGNWVQNRPVSMLSQRKNCQ